MSELDQLKEKLKKVEAEGNENFKKYSQYEKKEKQLDKELKAKEKELKQAMEIELSKIRQEKEKVEAEKRAWWRKCCETTEVAVEYRRKIIDMEAKKKR